MSLKVEGLQASLLQDFQVSNRLINNLYLANLLYQIALKVFTFSNFSMNHLKVLKEFRQ